MKEQYGVKIDTELVDELEKIKFENGCKSREELLGLLAEVYKNQKNLKEDEQLDLSHYDELEDDAKQAIKDGFELIITTVKQYNKKTKQAAHELEQEKESIAEDRLVLENQLKDIQLAHSGEIKKINEEHKLELKNKENDIVTLKSELQDVSKEKQTLETRLQTAYKETENLKSIAENTQATMNTNLQLQKEIKDLNDLHAEKLDTIKISHSELTNSLNAQIKELQNKNISLIEENSKLSSDNRFNEKELSSLKSDIIHLKSEYQSNLDLISKGYNDEKHLLKEEILSLKSYEKENIALQTKLTMAYEEIERLKKNK